MMSIDKNVAKNTIEAGNAVLGIEFGSTRIKAVLIGGDNAPIASGSYDWENDYIDGIWTYSLDKIHTGLKDCYADLLKDVKEQYGVGIKKLRSIGFSHLIRMESFWFRSEHGEIPLQSRLPRS